MAWKLTAPLSGVLFCLATADAAFAQSYGADLHNVANPASGGMAGVSLARPQDTPSALFGNPAAMTQFKGTHFTFGGSFIEPTYNASHDGFVTGPLGGGAFSGKSEAEPSAVPAVAVLQELELMGIPTTFGMGLTALSGAATSFRQFPESFGTSTLGLILGINSGVGVQITDELSAGAALTIGTGVLDAVLTRTTSATADFGVRGTFGVDYELPMCTTAGAFYQTKLAFDYDDLFRLPNGTYTDIKVDQPANIGFGVANRSLMEGKLLLAFDILYKFWEDASFYDAVYRNQWAYAFGAQYTMGRIHLRAGYSYSDNPIRDDVGVNVGGAQIGAEAVRYLQATEAAAIYKHRITAGAGIENVLPNVNADFFVGGMLREEQNFGTHSAASIQAWYTGFGLTWHFGPQPRCNDCPPAVPETHSPSAALMTAPPSGCPFVSR